MASFIRPILCASLLWACGGAEESTSTKSGACTEDGRFVESNWMECAPKNEALLSLVSPGEPGAEGLRELRYSGTSGQEEIVEVHMDMDMSMSMGPMGKVEMPLPQMRLTMNTKVLSADTDPNIRSSMEITGGDIGEATGALVGQEAEIRAVLQGTVGIRGETTMTRTGRVLDGGFDVPDGAPEEVKQQLKSMKQSIAQTSVPLPDEPVGPGAVWETLVRTLDEQTGMDLVVHNAVELVSWDGEKAILSYKLTQKLAPDSKLDAGGLPPGAEMEVKAFESGGSGEITLEKGLLNPRESKGDVQLSAQLLVKAQGQEMEMEMETNVRVHLFHKDEVAPVQNEDAAESEAGVLED